MTYFIIGLIIGLFLGAYFANKNFRDKCNAKAKSLFIKLTSKKSNKNKIKL